MLDDDLKRNSTTRIDLAELVEAQAAKGAAGGLRLIGSESSPIALMPVRSPPGQLNVPAVDCHRFNVQLSGVQELSSFALNGESLPIQPIARAGTVSFIPAGRALSAQMAGDEFDGFRVLIPRERMRKAIERVFGREIDDATWLAAHFGSPSAQVHQIAQLLHAEFGRLDRGSLAFCESLVDALCIELVRRLGGGEGPVDCDDRIRAKKLQQRILALLDEAALEPQIKLADIAERLGIAPYQLTRQFQAGFSETPARYLQRKRLERARRLLKETGRPIIDIAIDCGFSSQAHMTHLFRRAFGTTPARFRYELQRSR